MLCSLIAASCSCFSTSFHALQLNCRLLFLLLPACFHLLFMMMPFLCLSLSSSNIAPLKTLQSYCSCLFFLFKISFLLSNPFQLHSTFPFLRCGSPASHLPSSSTLHFDSSRILCLGLCLSLLSNLSSCFLSSVDTLNFECSHSLQFCLRRICRLFS